MAKIDKLTTMMVQRGIQCAMLVADKPSRIFVAGQESPGPVLETARLTEMVAEITPENFRSQWEQHGSFLFPYESAQGVFDVGVRYEGQTLQVTIARHVAETVEATARNRSSLAAPKESGDNSAGSSVMIRPGVERPRLSQMSQIVGLALLATLIGFGLIILVLRMAGPLNPTQLGVVRVFAVLWGVTALVWATGCMRVASKRAELDSLLPPGYQLTPAEKLQMALAKVPDFEITQQFIEPDRHSAIAIDENAKKICFITIPNVSYHEAYLEQAREVAHAYRVEHNVKYVPAEKVHNRTSSKFPGYDPETDTRRGVYPFRAILESRLLEDGNTLFKTARTSAVGSALLNNLMTSKAGRAIDESIVEASNQEQFKSIDLRILTNDQNEPVHMLHFLHIEGKDAGPMYRTAMRQAEHCHTFMSDLINALDNEDKAAELEQQKEIQHEFLTKSAIAGSDVLPPSIAAYAKDSEPVSTIVDELKRLTELRTHAAITQEEFDSLKAKLLAS